MRELVLHYPQEYAEAVSDALLALGALSVSVEDADSQTQEERPLYGEPGLAPGAPAWPRNRLIALLAQETDPAQLMQELRSQQEAPQHALPLRYGADWQVREVPDADWVRVTQAQFGPIHIGQHIRVVPSWHQQDADLSAVQAHAQTNAQRKAQASSRTGTRTTPIRIELDPGLAFGTGSHPTTHLCLAWLETHLTAGSTVLDYGCGSGILAIAAKLLGAGAVDAVDIDEQAVQGARFNAQRNKVDVRVMLPDELSVGLSKPLPAQPYQVVVANILSSPLKVLAPMLANRVARGGYLVLSGVLARQADEVARAYAPWLTLTVWQEREGWVCLHGQKTVGKKPQA